MKKFKFLVKFGLKKRVYRKAFVIANIVIAILLIAIVNLPTIIGWFTPEEDPITNIHIDLYNETTQADVSDQLSVILNESFGGYEYYLIDEKTTPFSDIDLTDPEQEKAFWDDEDWDIVIVFKGSVAAPTFDLYSKTPEHNPLLYGQLERLIILYQIDDYQAPVITPVMPPDYESPEEEMLLSSMMTILILPMFILITMATQFVGIDIIEEKSTKAIETIISSVPANIHFLSKITSSIFFVIIQGGLILVYSAVAALIGNQQLSGSTGMPGGPEVHLLKYVADLFPNWPIVVLFSVLFMIIGTLFYLVIAALFASMAVTQEDYQQFQSPLMLMLLGGFYIGIFAPMAGGSGFMKIMSFVPIFTPILAPVAFAAGSITLVEAIIALIVMIIFLVLATLAFAPVYKVAILSYDQTKFFKRIGSYFKKAFQKNGKRKLINKN